MDFEAVIKAFKKDYLFNHVVKFIVQRAKFLTENELQHMKVDMISLMNIFKLYAIHFITEQAVLVMEISKKKKKKKRVANPQNDDADSDFSDYSDQDFSDLLSNTQIEQNIKIVYDRINELMNPIDNERLKVDSI